MHDDLNQDLVNLQNWLPGNKLSLNLVKTQSLIIGSRLSIQQIKKQTEAEPNFETGNQYKMQGGKYLSEQNEAEVMLLPWNPTPSELWKGLLGFRKQKHYPFFLVSLSKIRWKFYPLSQRFHGHVWLNLDPLIWHFISVFIQVSFTWLCLVFIWHFISRILCYVWLNSKCVQSWYNFRYYHHHCWKSWCMTG